ncbi:type II toxin-antitoxin system RelE/ParE family toxin [Nitrosospira briensis]|uniref:type II toxin-antitoxin system RelE/ParE family toxin n=1 Tax=Nitrosospira briensis TaxID=35799 RepID=UPI000469C736|nr:type II toxin-antitoxin system RelE/ParE family toxin [Nitrosospira briensis]
MSVSVVFLRSAEIDLKELKSDIVKNLGKKIWQADYRKIQEVVGTLQTSPLQGKMPEELGRLNLTRYRQVISGMNRIIYEVRQETIYIHVVCDTRKDMKSLVAKRLLRII